MCLLTRGCRDRTSVVSSLTRHKTDDSTGLAKQVAADPRIVKCSRASPAATEGVRRGGEANAALVGAKSMNDDRLAQGKTGVGFENREGGRG